MLCNPHATFNMVGNRSNGNPSQDEMLRRFFQQNRRRLRAIELARANREVAEVANHPPVRVAVDSESDNESGKKFSSNIDLKLRLIVSHSPSDT